MLFENEPCTALTRLGELQFYLRLRRLVWQSFSLNIHGIQSTKKIIK